jgi:phenylacetate-CoA ligase
MISKLDIPESREQLLALQSARKRMAVERARRAPFWRGKLKDIDLEKLDDQQEWSKIPVLTKDELRQMPLDTFYNDFVIVPRGAFSEFWRSGGSTGKPLFYPRTEEDIQHALCGFRRVFAAAGARPEDIAFISMPLGIHPAGHLMARAAEQAGLGVAWVGAGSAVPSAMQLELLQTFKPSIWVGMSSYGIHLANLARAEGIEPRDFGIRKIICTAEPISDSKRDKIRRLWGAELYDSLGMTEMTMMAAETDDKSGFRLWSDYVYPEVLDPETLEPVPPGEIGVLVVTSLATNHATPFLRWNTGDMVSMWESDADAGAFSVFPMFRHAHRTSGFFKVRGVNIGHADFEDVIFRLPVVSDFRVEVLDSDGRDILRIHTEASPDAAWEEVERAVLGAVRTRFEISAEVVSRSPGDIAKDFESAVKAPRFSDHR